MIKKYYLPLSIILLTMACREHKELEIDVYETNAQGAKLEEKINFVKSDSFVELSINPEEKYQKITGFGGSFTEASAYLLSNLSQKKRNEIIQAYFGDEGARYSLTRTHIASCDFSLSNYTYAPVANDLNLEHFTIAQDTQDLIPMILAAKEVSTDGFKIIASPWTAPPWMKDNKEYVGGKLLPKYYDTYSRYFSRYLEEYKKQNIDIWGVTVVNEPHGNGNNWESMHFSPAEMTDLVQNHMGPILESEGWDNVKILGYDQNRAGLKEWVDEMYKDELSAEYFDGTAIHWYESTYEVFPDALQYAHQKRPDKYLIETEGCVDSEVPAWQDDKWYWTKEATDWGWDWAGEEEKYLHPKYAPAHRYARDIIGCLNNYVDGWIDWNMVLDKQGGPNWFKNWCAAPVLADIETDEVYLTPIYYVMTHFSKFIRPGAVRIGLENSSDVLQATAFQNPNKEFVLVVFNESEIQKAFNVKLNGVDKQISINPQAIQTIILK